MKFKVMFRNSSVIKICIIRPKPGSVAKMQLQGLPAGNRTRVLWISRCGFDSQPEGLGVAFFATGYGLGLVMYILTTLEFLNITLNFIYGVGTGVL